MNKKTYYIGFDVHKEPIAIAYALGGSREEATYHGSCSGSVLSTERALRKAAKKLEIEFHDRILDFRALCKPTLDLSPLFGIAHVLHFFGSTSKSCPLRAARFRRLG